MATAEQRKTAEDMLARALSEMADHGDTGVIENTVNEFAPVLKSMYGLEADDFIWLVNALQARFVTTMTKGVVLTDNASAGDHHDDTWPEKRDIAWSYSRDYSNFLIDEGWSPLVIRTLDTVTSRILGLIEDPQHEGEWERRGLVMGQVQSGKTANYIGLIAKAADAGYKFIIVIAGIHNELRTQTQARIDQGFIGRNSETKAPIGVGRLSPNRAFPVTVTTTAQDFNSVTGRNFGIGLDALSNTFILVIKKNASTLDSLYTWLKTLNTRKGFERIADIPMLLIDDEADNASINTSQSDLNPTRINREIRRILNLFRKRCYVGYTATPFANIFINPDADVTDLGSDLFPKHFIYSLDAPTDYLGYERVFMDEDEQPPIDQAQRHPFVRELTDVSLWLPATHKRYEPVEFLPRSLRHAIHLFILARAIRNLRGQADRHASMLVNVSRFVDIQNAVASLIRFYVQDVQGTIRYNYALPGADPQDNRIWSELLADFNHEYAATEFTWAEVRAALNDAAQSVRVVMVNSRSTEKLMYAAYKQEGVAATVIAVGGLSLSRGLTLEGLTISYMHRNTKMYDTLLQMGRWFGYRSGYEDVCRIFMSPESIAWYRHIAEATDELRNQLRRMQREGRTPGDFGLYVRAHPDTLTITALNKMYHTEGREFKVSYDGKLVETYVLPDSEQKIQANRELYLATLEDLRTEHVPYREEPSQSLLFYKIEAWRITEILETFRFHELIRDKQDMMLKYIKAIADQHPFWDIGFVSVSRSRSEERDLPAVQFRTVGYVGDSIQVPALESGWYTGNKNRFSGNSMFHLGLSDQQLKAAQQEAESAPRPRKAPIFRDYTNARGRPLLLLHRLTLRDKAEVVLAEDIPALSVSFPNDAKTTTITYIVGPVWLRNMREQAGDPEEDDDGIISEPLG